MTQDDIDNGVIVEVPVAPGDIDVSVNATITDSAGNSDTDSDNKPVDNLPPVATLIADQSDMDSDQINLDISSYFNDAISGNNLTYAVAGLPDGLSIDPATGVISGTIDHSASQYDSDGDGQADGEYSVTITVTDEAGNSTDATFTWTVGNPPPIAKSDTNTTLEDTPLHVDAAGGVLANDHDPDGDDQLTVTEFVVEGQTYSAGDTAIITGVGELTLNDDGSYSFVPEPDWHGDVPTVTYTVSDGEGGTDTAELNITVEPVLDITLTATPQVTEGDKITVTASVESPVAGEPLHVILNNGQTITIPVGATSASIEVDSRPDDVYEQGTTTETFEVVNAVGGNEHINGSSLGSSATTGIVDDSDVTTVSVSTTDVTEDDAEVTFVFQLSNPPQTGETVTLTVDVAGTEHIITVDATGRAELKVPTQDSDVYVDPDSLTATVTDIIGGNFEATDLTGASATAQISDTIDVTSVSLTAGPDLTEAGGTLTYTVTLGADVRSGDDPVEVTFTDLNGDSQTIIISSGNTGTVDVTIPPTLFEDPYIEAAEDLLVATDVVVTGGTDFEQLGSPSVGTVELTDSIDDTTATLTVSGSGDEDNGSITYTVTLDNPPQADQKFNVTLSNGQTVEITVPANGTSGSITFGWGTGAVAGTQPLTGYPDGDVYVEPDFDLEVTDFVAVNNAGNFENLVTQDDTTPITISDTPTPVTVTLSDIVGQEGELHTITATVDHPVTGSDLVITLSNGETITIVVGATSGTSDPFEIQTDDVYVDGESYDVTITGTTGGNFEDLVTTDTASVTVTDTIDPVYAKITVDHEAVLEGGELTYTVSLVDGDGNPVTVEAGASVTVQLDWSGAAATAADLDNFAGLPGSVTIGAGQSESTFTVTTLVDAVNEYSEPLNVTITGVDDTAGATKLFEELRVSTSEGSVSSDILDAPTIGGSVTVYEKGLGNASDDSESAGGVIRITAPSGLDSIVVDGQSISLADLQALDASSPVIITITGHGTLTLTGFTPTQTVNGEDAAWEISYTYTLTDNQTHNAPGIDDLLYEIDLEVVAGNPLGGTTIAGGTLDVTVVDDVPVVERSSVALGEVQVDETTLGDSASADFSGAFSHDFGADGDGGLVYTLEVDTAATGLLDTETGDPIVLVASPDGLTVTGHVGDDSGPAAFTISVDANGEVTLTQNRPLHHTDPNNHDDVLRLPDGSLKLTATATDGDGDTDSASVDIGGRFSFKDDGPTIGAAPTPGAVDEAYLTTGSGDGAAGLSTQTGADLDVNFGADGQGSLVFSGEQVALRTWLDASGNTDIIITGTGTSELSGTRGGQEIFTVTLTVDADGQASYHFELKGAMLHRDSAQNHELTFNYEAVDGDGDRANGTFVVEVVDDNPRTELTIEVDEDKSHGPFNTSADATQDNISISMTDGGPAVSGTLDGTDMLYDVGHGTVTVHDDGKVTYTPKPDYSNHGGSDEFYVKVNEDHGGSQTKVTVNVLPEADAPVLEANKQLDTPEDTAVLLELKLPGIKDAVDQNLTAGGDDPERLGAITLTVNPSGTPDPATPGLAYTQDGTGTEIDLIPSSSGVYTIVIVENTGDTTPDTDLHHSGTLPTGDVNYLTRAEYESLQATPDGDRHENFEVVVSVKSYEVDGSGVPLDDSQVVGTNGAESSQTITVDVQAVTDEVALELKADPSQPDIVIAPGNKSADITMSEDTSFDLTAILIPDAFKDTDGSETRYLGFDGLPVGTIVTVDGTEYTIGAPGIPTQDFGSGPVPVIVMPGTQTSLPQVSIRPPQDFSGDLENIKVILGARDSDADSPSADPQLESDEITLNLYVKPVAGDVTERSSHTIDEDNPVTFLSGIKVTDDSRDATGGEVITQVVFSLPTDNGAWTLTSQPAPQVGWSMTGSGTGPYVITFDDSLTQVQREEVLGQFEVTPPAHSSLDAGNWVIEVTTVDSQVVDGLPVLSDSVQTNHVVTVTVNPVAERTDSNTDGQNGNDVTINPDHVYDTSGVEDTPLDLGVDGGFRLSGGWSNEDGKWVDGGAGSWAADTTDGRSEDTYALLTPYTTDNDAQAGATPVEKLLGSIFTYSDGTDTHTLVFTGEPVAIPMQYLDSVTFQGPKDWFGVVKIEVNARTVDYDEDDGSATAPADSGQSWLTNLIIQPKADKVTLKVDANPGTVEDKAVTLNIRPTTSSNRTDVDTTFDVSIAGIPEGAQVEYGGVTYVTDASLPAHDPADDTQPTGMYQAADGSYVLVIRDFDEADQPILTPPKSSNETIKLSVTADSVDTLTYIDKDGNPQTVTSRGSEQTPSLTHTLPIEVEVLGVPNEPDMVIVDGVYTEDAGDQSSGQLEVALDELITSLESGEINAGADGSETVTLRISNLPEGFELIGAGPVITGEGDNRVWVVTQKDLDDGNITIRVPQHWSGTLEFTVQPVVTENDNKAEKFFDEHNVKFTVNPVAEATLSISSNLLEDTVGELQLAPVGADSDEYISEVRIAVDDLPAGVTLYADAAGSTPLVAGGDGYYTISNPGTSGAPSVYVKGPANFSGRIELDIEYKVTDPSTDGSLAADVSDWKTGDHTLNFVPHTDQIGMGVTGATGSDVVTDLNAGVTTKTGVGTVDVTLDISQLADSNAGGAVDTDGSEQLTHIVVSGLAPGVSVQGAIDIGGGRWLLQVNEDWDGSADLSQTLTFVIGPYASDFESEITITAYSRDQGAAGQSPAGNQERAEISWQLNYVGGTGEPAELPEVSLTPTDIAQSEDSSFQLGDVVTGGATGGQNNGDPYELTVTIRTSPDDDLTFAGLTPTLVVENGEQVVLWTATTTVGTGDDPAAALQAVLDSITVHAPSDANRNNLDGPLELDITASVHTQGVSREVQADIEVDIAPVTDDLGIGVGSVSVDEGADIPLNITVPSNTVDGELGGSGDASWEIENDLVYIHIPDGGLEGELTDASGTPLSEFTGTPPAGTPPGGKLYAVSPEELAGLKFVPDASLPHQTGSLDVTVLVEHKENGGDTKVSTGTGSLAIHQSNSGYEADITAEGDEHSVSADSSKAIKLQFGPDSGLVDAGETIESAFLSGLPDGFTVYYQSESGDSVLANNAGDGTWVIPVSGGQLPEGIAILPPKHWSGTLEDLKLTVRSGHAGQASNPSEVLFDLVVTPQADGLELNPTLSFGIAGDKIALNLNSHMKDPREAVGADGDEHTERTHLELSGFPDGEKVQFYTGAAGEVDLIEDGRATYDGSKWVIQGLTQSELDNLQFVHGTTTGNQTIDVVAKTYEVDAAGNQVGGYSDEVDGTIDINVDATLPSSGDDLFLWEGGLIDGLGGVDTVQLRFGDNLGGSDFDKLSNIEIIDMRGEASGDNAINGLSVEDVFSMTDNANVLQIFGDAGDSVDLRGGGWTADGDGNYTGTHNGITVTLEVQGAGILID
ncbi:immunoglobulin-like domain-containing protein [Halopseudomonas xiamenensis]|uniref:immunoglobulin-like domain-containing protein n=1 Tax=Halopseudomonas xiamenensis TaxID=157792 RepID=UPI001C8A1F6D|nr:immunoglobulin-like domain-containing protein [Halopseudomonas xiamenensis]